MNTDALLSSIREALAACTDPRLFETERGFQGQLLVELSKRICLPDGAIVEQEYQKQLKKHGLKIRPDMVIHEPYDSDRHSSRANGNIAVIELKLRAKSGQAIADFESLASMLKVLQYPLGVFININSSETHATLVPAEAKGHIVAYAVSPGNGRSHVIEART